MNDVTGIKVSDLKLCINCGNAKNAYYDAVGDLHINCNLESKDDMHCSFNDHCYWKPIQPQTPQPCCDAAVKAERERIKKLEAVIEAAKKFSSFITPGDKYTKATIEIHCDICGQTDGYLSDKADEVYDNLKEAFTALEEPAND